MGLDSSLLEQTIRGFGLHAPLLRGDRRSGGVIAVLIRNESLDGLCARVPQPTHKAGFQLGSANAVQPPTVQCGEAQPLSAGESSARLTEWNQIFRLSINGHEKTSLEFRYADVVSCVTDGRLQADMRPVSTASFRLELMEQTEQLFRCRIAVQSFLDLGNHLRRNFIVRA